MRTNTNNHLRRSAAAIAASLLLGGLTALAQPFALPDGDWDCTMSGGRSGLAQISFAGNTFTIFEILVPKRVVVNTSFTESRGADGDSRGGPTGGGVTNHASTNLFGAGGLTGPWNFD